MSDSQKYWAFSVAGLFLLISLAGALASKNNGKLTGSDHQIVWSFAMFFIISIVVTTYLRARRK